MKYRVIQQHYGDRQYWSGDEREIDDDLTAEQLIKAGLIAEIDSKAKAAPQNKANQAPKNK